MEAMQEFNPKLDGCCIECPLNNGEWMCCSITHNKCPKLITLKDYSDDDYWVIPDDCPAKKGVIIKITE